MDSSHRSKLPSSQTGFKSSQPSTASDFFALIDGYRACLIISEDSFCAPPDSCFFTTYPFVALTALAEAISFGATARPTTFFAAPPSAICPSACSIAAVASTAAEAIPFSSASTCIVGDKNRALCFRAMPLLCVSFDFNGNFMLTLDPLFAVTNFIAKAHPCLKNSSEFQFPLLCFLGGNSNQSGTPAMAVEISTI